jgi:3-oxoacyl-[acyl-carrier-protein] synthase II
MGAVTPIGLSTEEFWQAMLDGRSGGRSDFYFDASGYNTKIAAEVKHFDPLNYMDKKAARRMDAFTQFAIAATEMALQHSGCLNGTLDPTRAGVIFGSGIGGMWTYHRQSELFFKNGDRNRSVLSSSR